VLLLGLAACNQLLGIEDPPGAGMPDAPAVLPECTAQRLVHLVGSDAGVAWFSLVWPAPAVITGFQPTYTYDNPAEVKDITREGSHPLYARRIGTRAVWEGVGADPHPSVLVAGVNETFTTQPQSIVINGGVGLDAAAAAIQTSLAPRIPVLQINPAGPYGAAVGAPAQATMVSNLDTAIAAFTFMLGPAIEAELRPGTVQLSSYIPPNALQREIDLATYLAFAANAFRLGLLGTIMVPTLRGDIHSPFLNGGTERVNNLTAILEAFYRDLSTSPEIACVRDGKPFTLADNVVLVAIGDTPKNTFEQSWADGTPGGANWMYLRSNGFTRPGWFGQVLPGGRTNWNPTTGALDPMATVASSTGAAFAGTLYAIARGNRATVQVFTSMPFDGLILR
jgi:hypothetical protein